MKFLTAIVLSAVALVAFGEPDRYDKLINVINDCKKVEFPKVYKESDKTQECMKSLVDACSKLLNRIQGKPGYRKYKDVQELNDIMKTLRTTTVDLTTVC